MAKISHLSHGMGDAITGHHKPNIAQDGAPKNVHGVAVAFGQRSRSSAPGLLSGAPKRLTPVATSFGQRSRGPNLHSLGEAMLAAAFACDK